MKVEITVITIVSVVVFIGLSFVINEVKCQNPPSEIYKTLWCE